MMKQTLIVTVLATVVSACATTGSNGETRAEQANRIAQQTLIIDTHIDVPYRIRNHWEDVTKATDGGNFDLPRARAGGLNAPFMSIYIPARYEDEGGGWQLANELIDGMEALAARAPNDIAMAYASDDLVRHQANGQMSLVLGMENGTPIEGKLENVQFFFDRGIRYITLAHSLSNHISDSSYDTNRQWDGLSPFGIELVKEMNRVGIMIDVSHLSDAAFHDVIETSKVPVLATHSSARHFTPGFERNMSDELIRKLAANGGVIQINFGTSFLTQTAQDWRAARNQAGEQFMQEQGFSDTSDPRLAEWTRQYTAANPFPFATLDETLDHFDYVVKLVGIDYVGIGSDYDGVGDSLPIGLKDVSTFPNLIEGLLARGYSESDISKILSGNTLRVWQAAEQYAAGQQ